ncbi:MAG: PSP1 domain-containing protein, partial [Bacteroidota bacterium]
MELHRGGKTFDCVEVRFKNTRKGFYRNTENLELKVGDVVAVEAMSGHDIGTVSLTGELVRLQMNRQKGSQDGKDIKRIYRAARDSDIDRWKEAMELEDSTMFKARTIASELQLDMKIGDVEYQGDKTKATFYYTAEDRVDFRELIKIFADRFR